MVTDSPVRSRGQEGQGNRPGEGPHPGPRVRWRGAGLASTLLLLVLALPLGARAQTPCTESSPAVIGAVTGGPNVTGLAADCATLLGLKDTLSGTATLNWAENLAMTSWDGITVAGDPPRVTVLKLRDKALSGTIPPALGQLTALTHLYLDINDGLETNDNNLSGEIPKELGDLTALTSLYLDNNNLIGEIPKELGKLTALTHLYLHDNALSGAIPAELGDMSALTSLDLHNNNLSGAIPKELGDASKLTGLYLYNNALSGAIPKELGNPSNIDHLHLYNNALSGEIPAELGNLKFLDQLYLDNNNLSGEIPAALGELSDPDDPTGPTKLDRLRHLYLHNNNLSGPLPSTLGNLKLLNQLYLHNNKLSGPIPEELGDLDAKLFSQLYLNNNALSGEIPAALGGLTALTEMRLHNNKLSGPLPEELGQLTALTHLLLYNNALLRDPLPPTLTNLTISELHVQNTQITATTTDTDLETWLGGRTVTTGTQTSIRTITLDAENTSPRGMWSDETTLWVADYADGDGDKLYAYTLATGRRDTTKDVPLDADNRGAVGLWSDGTTLWVSDFDDDKLYAYDLTTRSRDDAKDMAVLEYPRGLWGNETTLWVANWQNIYAYSRSNGSRDTSKDITPFPANNDPRGLWSDGTTLWSPSDRDDARLYAYDLATGQHDPASYRSNHHILDPANANPQGLWSDGTTLWVNDSVQHKVYAYRNERLQAVGTLPAQKLAVGGVVQTLTVTSAFRDPDGDALTYSATSLDEMVATVTVSGAEVTVRPVAVGTVTITVTATAGSKMPVDQRFEVTVVDELLPNQEPQAVGGLPAQMLAVGGVVQTLPVTSAFRDPDGDALTYAVTSSDTRIATARIVSQNADEGASRATTRSSDTRIAAVQGAEVVEVRPVAVGTVTITVTATDADGLNQTTTQSFTVTVAPRPPRPPVTGGGSGGGGSGGGGSGGGGSGGGSTASRDAHGNSPAQATRITPGATAPWASSTPGQINTEADIDYFTLTVPQAGVLVVETTGFTATVGTVWQEGEELGMADSGGVRRNFRLAVPVEAGPVVIAVAGNGSRTGAYTLRTQLVVGYLENPGRDSFQSGIGVLSGWVCEAGVVEIELNGVPQEAAYGTERVDTAGVCGDTDNGFGLLFNWNLLRDGEHEVVALVDGVELDRATVTVTTLGSEFLRDVTGTCAVPDFPLPGETVTLEWQQTSQNFVIAEGAAPAGVNRAGIAGVGYLENPGANSFQSGIGVISGWVCAADAVEIAIGDLALQGAGYGTERLDTEDVCGDTANGFGLLFNWNLLGEGEHAVVAYVDGEELGRATVRVTTVGEGAEEEFLRGAEGECVVEDFPMPGETVTVEWQQNSQNFVITAIE